MELLIRNATERRNAAQHVLALDAGKAWHVKIDLLREKRSQSQNARLWVLHQMVAQHIGVSPEDMHEEALCRFFGYEEKKIGGFIRRIPLERSSLQDTKRFTEFMEATEHWYREEFEMMLP